MEVRSARRAGSSLTPHQIIDIERQVIKSKQREVQSKGLSVPTDFEGKRLPGSGQSVGLVVDGGALAVALAPEHIDELVALCTSCKSVVCCRVSPQQKAAMTKLVQIKCNAITLGIGDGANDVGMIQAAHIGCGISGREGRAAVLVSDYAFAQFKYVARLVLLHGRIMHKRNTEVVWYSVYKNWAHNGTFVFFAFVSAFSAQPLNTAGLLATFNLFWTALPIIVFAITEQDVSQDTASRYPILYQETMEVGRRHFMNTQLKWLVMGSWHALVCYFLPMYSMSEPDQGGVADDFLEIGSTIYVATIIVVNLKLALRTRHWTVINHVVLWVSIVFILPFLWLYGLTWEIAQVSGTANMSRTAHRLFAGPRFWLAGVILAPALSLLPDIAVIVYQRTFMPSTAQLLQEAEYLAGGKTIRYNPKRPRPPLAGPRPDWAGPNQASTSLAGSSAAPIELRAMVPDKRLMSHVAS